MIVKAIWGVTVDEVGDSELSPAGLAGMQYRNIGGDTVEGAWGLFEVDAQPEDFAGVDSVEILSE